MSFRIVNFSAYNNPAPRAGLLVNDRVHELSQLVSKDDGIDTSSTFALLQNWDRTQTVLDRVAGEVRDDGGMALDDVVLHAPLTYPGAIFCAAANFSDHVEEMNHGYKFNRDGFRPYFFLKAPPSRAIAHPNTEIEIPSYTKKLDWEAELAFVIGKRAKNVTAQNAMDHVAGFTIINDLSARDHLFREDWKQFKTDWFGQKCFDNSVPMGPWIVPASDLQDLSDLRIRLWLNDELRQDTGTRFMIFNVAEQIEALSKQITLEPGDLVCTAPAPVSAANSTGRSSATCNRAII